MSLIERDAGACEVIGDILPVVFANILSRIAKAQKGDCIMIAPEIRVLVITCRRCNAIRAAYEPLSCPVSDLGAAVSFAAAHDLNAAIVEGPVLVTGCKCDEWEAAKCQ